MDSERCLMWLWTRILVCQAREDGPSDGGREGQGRGGEGQDLRDSSGGQGQDHGEQGPVRQLHLRQGQQKASETAEAAKEKASRAAEQVKSMAQGDKETVKQSFGMGGDDRIDRDDPTLYRDEPPCCT